MGCSQIAHRERERYSIRDEPHERSRGSWIVDRGCDNADPLSLHGYSDRCALDGVDARESRRRSPRSFIHSLVRYVCGVVRRQSIAARLAGARAARGVHVRARTVDVDNEPGKESRRMRSLPARKPTNASKPVLFETPSESACFRRHLCRARSRNANIQSSVGHGMILLLFWNRS